MSTPNDVLVHISPNLDEVLGVWIMGPSGPEPTYDSSTDEADVAYGESLVTAEGWEYQLEHLPEVSPYVAAWAVDKRRLGESARDVLSRLRKTP